MPLNLKSRFQRRANSFMHLAIQLVRACRTFTSRLCRFCHPRQRLCGMCGLHSRTLSVERGSSAFWPEIRQTFTGHSHRVMSVAFSPDSSRVVSGSYDGTVRIWDAVSGAPNNEPLQRCLGRVRSVSFSPDGTQAVRGSDQCWREKDLRTNKRKNNELEMRMKDDVPDKEIDSGGFN